MIAPRESAELAHELIAATCDKEGIARGQLTLHADRGTSMRSKPVALLLADLGVTTSHSRPHVSDDNPYSEAQFKTLKYQPDFPARFDSIENARAFCQRFFAWYNHAHRHSGIGYMTPAAVHTGQAPRLYAARQQVLHQAFLAHPERFTRRYPTPPASAGRGGHQLSKTHAARTRGTAAFDTKLPATGVSKSLTHSESVASGRFRRIIFLSSKERELTADGQRALGYFVVPTYLEMLNAIARELGQAETTKTPENERPELILRALRDADVLLVLDNLETVPEPDRDQLFAFVNRLPRGSSAIVTSRRRADASAVVVRLDRLDWEAACALIAELGRDFPRSARPAMPSAAPSTRRRAAIPCSSAGSRASLVSDVAPQSPPR